MRTNIDKGFSRQPHITSSGFPQGSMQITEQEYEKYLTISKGLSVRSIKTYLQRFRIISRWLKDNNHELSKRTVEDFLYEKRQRFGNAGVNSYIQTLNHIAGCYKSHGFDSDFMADIKCLPKKRSDRIPLSLEEALKLLNTPLTYLNRNGVDCTDLDLKYLTLTEFIIITACRYNEAATLKVSQLDIDNGRAFLTDTKNKEPRYLFFNGPVKEHLKLLIKDKNPDSLVFTNSKGSSVHSGDFWNNLLRRSLKAGITKKIFPHLLRHTNASLYYNQTHDIAMVATILGHKDIQVTYDTYVHMDTAAIQQATNRNPLVSQYIPKREVLLNAKATFDNLRLSEDKRFQCMVKITDNRLEIVVDTTEA